MKKAYIISFLLSMLAFLPACQKDDAVLGTMSVTAPVISTLTQANYLLAEPATGENAALFRLTWSKARFTYESGDPAQVESVSYEVQADLTDNGFAHPVVCATTTSLYYDAFSVDLNNLVKGFVGNTNGDLQNISFRIKTSYLNGTSEFSDPILVGIKPYIHKYIVITAPTEKSYLLTEPETGVNPAAFELAWTKARFDSLMAISEPIAYIIEADMEAGAFAKPTVMATTTRLDTIFNTKELNSFVLTLSGATTEAAQNLLIRVKVAYSNGVNEYSEPITVTVTPFIHRDAVPNVYVIGDMNEWNNANKDYVMFRNSNNAADGVYTYTGYFSKATYLKFSNEANLGSWDNMYYAGADGVLIKGKNDGGAFYAAIGYYTFTIDIYKMTWTMVEYDGSASKSYTNLGPIGGFCSWDNEPPMTQSTFDIHQWRLQYTFTDATAVKFRGDKDWANNWGGKSADNPYGLAIFDGPGADVKAGTYDIYFNDLTGHYAINPVVVL